MIKDRFGSEKFTFCSLLRAKWAQYLCNTRDFSTRVTKVLSILYLW